jgi:hypothetical protein
LLEEGTLRSTALEVLPPVSYSIGQALEVVDGSCIRGLASHTSIDNQTSSRIIEQKSKFYRMEGSKSK